MKTTLNFMKKNASLVMFAMMLSLIFIEPSFAWQESVTKFADNISTALKAISAGVLTVAVIFVGYQIAFNGKSINSLMPVIIGGLVIGSAAALAGTITTPVV
ncbi:MAG: hypothetical protein RL344_952 [Pseudomonadota bacterium]|jgi:type IV secretion system protein VirB2